MYIYMYIYIYNIYIYAHIYIQTCIYICAYSWPSHVAHMNESCHEYGYRSHVTHLNKSQCTTSIEKYSHIWF